MDDASLLAYHSIMSLIEYTHFSDALLAFESGIDPGLFDWYVENFDRQAIEYWRVERPGRLVRDFQTGEPLRRLMSIREYFESIGVLEYFDAGAPSCIVTMQLNSTNPWGFVGFQFGEELLIDLGYYLPARIEQVVDGISDAISSFYVGSVPCKNFSRGRRFYQHQPPDRAPVLASDVNLWGGQFTGLDNVWGVRQFRTLEAQRHIFARALSYNLARIEKELGTVSNIRKHFPYSGGISGLLAAAHLVGADAVVRRLRYGSRSWDEAGTEVDNYFQRFGRFDFEPDDIGCNQ